MPKQVFNKITIVGHAFLMDDDGEVMGEMATEESTCRTVEQITEVFEKIKADIAQYNAAQPNRRQRRAK